jgi:hypothetical protein
MAEFPCHGLRSNTTIHRAVLALAKGPKTLEQLRIACDWQAPFAPRHFRRLAKRCSRCVAHDHGRGAARQYWFVDYPLPEENSMRVPQGRAPRS